MILNLEMRVLEGLVISILVALTLIFMLNLFQIKRMLAMQARSQRIMRESKAEFAARVSALLRGFSVERINRLIDSMPRRVAAVTAARGQRVRY